MTLQSIIEQLQNIGTTTNPNYNYFGNLGTLGDISDISQQDIGAAMRAMYGNVSASVLPDSMFQGATFSPLMLQSVLQKTYSPQLQAQSQTLLGDLIRKTSGKNIRQAAGGFAGSAQMQDYMSGAKDVYGKGMSGVLSNVQAQKAQGIQNIQNIIDSWHQTAQSIAS